MRAKGGKMRKGLGIGLVVAALACTDPVRAGEAEVLLAKIKSVGREGAGNVEASKAWRELVRLGPGALIKVLAGLDDADATAANWIRSAADAIAERELNAGRTLPAKELEAFVLDTKHNGRARRQAFEWLARVDKTAPDRLIPGMLEDPSVELRRDAVARAIKEAEPLLKKPDKSEAKKTYRKLFDSARDKDQIDGLAKTLKELGVEVDLAAHFGFIRDWFLVAPFDSAGGVGYTRKYEPEKNVDLAAVYKGKHNAEARWKAHCSTHPYGVIDLNTALAKHKGAVAYAFCVLESPAGKAVDIRLGTMNAVRVFLNSEQIFAFEEYHHGMREDQYLARGKLKAGRNELLVKVCQNEQSEDWAQEWKFQLRICDATGGAVPLEVVTENKERQKR
jgi:hypothetical protein